MTPDVNKVSLAAEDEGGGIEHTDPLNDTTNLKKVDSPVEEEDPEETEDEEVKANCIGGFAGVQQSDMSSDEESEEDSDADGEEEPDDKEIDDGPVQFVSSQNASVDVKRPRAVLANSPSLEEDEDDDQDSTMDESESSEEESVDGAEAIGMSLEVTKLDESDDDSLSDASSQYKEGASSAGGIAGSDSESEQDEGLEGESEEEEEELEGESEEELEGESEEDDEEEELEDESEEDEADDAVADASESGDDMSDDDESTASVPLEVFKNCDGPSDVAELESALRDSRHENADDASFASDDSAMEDLQDPTLQSALLSDFVELEQKPAKPDTLALVKRVLSSSALLGRSTSSSGLNPTMLSPKRVCRASRGNSEGSSGDDLPPELSLGQAAFQTNQRVSLSDEDDEEQDRQLGEELQEDEDERERVSTPIPLLTPPSSPLRVEGYEEDTTICEWPSNLAVDSAMTATMDLRPPSPHSLQQTWEEEEEQLLASETTPKPTPGDSAFSSSLTPMMRGISVEPEAPYLSL